MNFEEIISQTIPFEDFELKERFTKEKYNVLPEQHLSKIKPLNSDANKSLENYLFEETQMMGQYKLNGEHFNSIIEIDLTTNSEIEFKKWLDDLTIDSNETILLYWNSWGSVFTNWEIFKMYYDDFYYPVSDDLIITNKNVNWLLYFFHEELVYFGTR